MTRTTALGVSLQDGKGGGAFLCPIASEAWYKTLCSDSVGETHWEEGREDEEEDETQSIWDEDGESTCSSVVENQQEVPETTSPPKWLAAALQYLAKQAPQCDVHRCMGVIELLPMLCDLVYLQCCGHSFAKFWACMLRLHSHL